MRIIVAHNYYQKPGGEDSIFLDEVALLRRHGHEVETVVAHNDEIKARPAISVALRTVWSPEGADRIRTKVAEFKPQIVHFHNFFPLFSPAAHWAAHRAGAAVVQSLHNFRLLCANAMLLRDGKICELCVGRKIGWPALRHQCYRDSALASAVVVGMNLFHRSKGTWQSAVNAYIAALSSFGREKLLHAGLPPERTYIKPNFMNSDPGTGDGAGGYAVFVGRLSPEKGVRVAVAAWRKLGPDFLPLLIVGAGPDLPEDLPPNVKVVGWKTREEVAQIMQRAALFIMPSQWYEGFPKVIVESIAVGTPIIASKLGAMSEIIIPGVNGYHFQTGDALDLAAVVQHALGDPNRLQQLRQTTRADYEQKYTAEINYQMLMEIYGKAIVHRESQNV